MASKLAVILHYKALIWEHVLNNIFSYFIKKWYGWIVRSIFVLQAQIAGNDHTESAFSSAHVVIGGVMQ